jgi:hypothetical protein
MANQMIALQARNPQLPDPARATTQMANLMNMASQQRAAQLQGERIRQEMEYARAGENRAEETQRLNVRKEDQAYRVAGMTELRNRGVGVLQSGSEEAYQLWLRQADAIDPDSAAVMRQIAPTFNKDAMTFAITKADEFIANNTSKRKTEIIYDKNGIPILVESGGNTDYEATPIVATKIRDVNQPPRATPTAPPVTAGADVDMRATRGANTTPQDLINQGMNPNNIPSGMPTSRPVSFNQSDMGGAGAVQMTPEVAQQIVDTAVKTGMMAQADFDQLMAMAPEQNKQPFMEMIQANNIKLQPSGMGQRPQSQFADLRSPAPQSQTAGLRGAPPMEQTLAQYRVGDPIQGRNPSVGAYPGSAQVPLGRLGAEKATEAQATADVNLRMAPEIAKATKLAERAVEQKSNATKAKYATEALLNELADRINTIDQLLRNKNRFSIVGPIEGNLPRLMQYGARADAQAAFDRIKNTATLTSLVDLRKSTETGASPVGANPTDKDAKIVEQAASEFIQTGEPSKFDANLIDMRRKLYRTYQSAQREHEGVYGDVLKDNPRLRLVVPKVSDRYISTKDLPKQKTPVKTPTSRLSAETRAKYGL